MEAQPDGPRVATPLGGLHEGEGSHARALAHSRSALVGRARGRQEARAAQLHRSSAEAVSIRRRAEAADRAAGARAARALLAAGGAGRNARARGLLEIVEQRAFGDRTANAELNLPAAVVDPT